MYPVGLKGDLYLRDRARGVLNSAILGLNERLGISGFEKAYSLFIVSQCAGKHIEPDRFLNGPDFLYFLGT